MDCGSRYMQLMHTVCQISRGHSDPIAEMDDDAYVQASSQFWEVYIHTVTHFLANLEDRNVTCGYQKNDSFKTIKSIFSRKCDIASFHKGQVIYGLYFYTPLDVYQKEEFTISTYDNALYKMRRLSEEI